MIEGENEGRKTGGEREREKRNYFPSHSRFVVLFCFVFPVRVTRAWKPTEYDGSMMDFTHIFFPVLPTMHPEQSTQIRLKF